MAEMRNPEQLFPYIINSFFVPNKKNRKEFTKEAIDYVFEFEFGTKFKTFTNCS